MYIHTHICVWCGEGAEINFLNLMKRKLDEGRELILGGYRKRNILNDSVVDF